MTDEEERVPGYVSVVVHRSMVRAAYEAAACVTTRLQNAGACSHRVPVYPDAHSLEFDLDGLIDRARATTELERELAAANPRQREAVVRVFGLIGEPEPVEQVADCMGISSQAISNLQQRFFRRARRNERLRAFFQKSA